jgi:hypothetical protein
MVGSIGYAVALGCFRLERRFLALLHLQVLVVVVVRLRRRSASDRRVGGG